MNLSMSMSMNTTIMGVSVTSSFPSSLSFRFASPLISPPSALCCFSGLLGLSETRDCGGGGGGSPSVFPLNRCKTIHLVRHGQGIHNVEGDKDSNAYMKPEYFDAHLTPLGWQEVDNLRKHVHDSGLMKRIDLVIASPLLRTLQTAVGVFGGEGHRDRTDVPPLMVENAGNSSHAAISSLNCPPIVAAELCREHMGVRPCDKRRSISEYQSLFPAIDFSLIDSNEDTWWKADVRETKEEIAARGLQFMNWLGTREEKEIAIVTHRAFLFHTLSAFGNYSLPSVKQELSKPFYITERHEQYMSMRSMMTVKVDINSSISTLTSTFPPSLRFRSAFPLLSLPSAVCCFSGLSKTVDCGDGGPCMFPLNHCKTVHLVRHAQGIHNVEGDKNYKAYMKPEYFDAQLSPLGWQEVDNLRKHVHDSGLMKRIDLVVASPLLRTLQTAVGVFGGEGYTDKTNVLPLMVANAGNSSRAAISSLNCPPIVAVELCREHLGVLPCNKRRSISEYQSLFPAVDFSLIDSDEDTWWKADVGETKEELAARGLKFMNWLGARKEKEIAIVSHSSFLFHTLSAFGNYSHPLVKKELSKHFDNCELRSVVIVDCVTG